MSAGGIARRLRAPDLIGSLALRYRLIMIGAALIALAGAVACASLPAAPATTTRTAATAVPTAPARATPAATPAARNPTAAPTVAAARQSPTAAFAGWAKYTSQRLRVALQHPATWQRKQGYDERYEGPDGFFALGAASATSVTGTATIDQIAAGEAQHKLQPYGSKPTVESLRIQGQEARLILPSADQPKEMQEQAGLIVRAPEPIAVDGQRYEYLVLYADQRHIREIAATLRFGAGQ